MWCRAIANSTQFVAMNSNGHPIAMDANAELAVVAMFCIG